MVICDVHVVGIVGRETVWNIRRLLVSKRLLKRKRKTINLGIWNYSRGEFRVKLWEFENRSDVHACCCDMDDNFLEQCWNKFSPLIIEVVLTYEFG